MKTRAVCIVAFDEKTRNIHIIGDVFESGYDVEKAVKCLLNKVKLSHRTPFYSYYADASTEEKAADGVKKMISKLQEDYLKEYPDSERIE